MIKRLEGIQKGQQVYIIPSDPRHNPYYFRPETQPLLYKGYFCWA